MESVKRGLNEQNSSLVYQVSDSTNLVIVTVAYATTARLFFFISLSSTLHHTLVDLIFLSYLIYSRDPYLILPIYLHVHSHTFLIFLSNALVYSMTSRQEQKRNNYLLVRRRAVFVGQLESHLGTHQLVG